VCYWWKDRADLPSGSRSLSVGQIFAENFLDSICHSIYLPLPTEKAYLPSSSIWNLVFKLSSGTLSQNTSAWGSMLAKHGSRPLPITPWNYKGESPWNYQEQLVDVESPCFVIHGSRLTHQRSCLAVRCSCSRCSSASPSTGLCSCHRLSQLVTGCHRYISLICDISFLYNSITYIYLSQLSQLSQVFLGSFRRFFKITFYFLNWTSTWNYLWQLWQTLQPLLPLTLSDLKPVTTPVTTCDKHPRTCDTFDFPIPYVH
jgi:hypothetical protein